MLGEYTISITSLRPEQMIQGVGILRYPEQSSEGKQNMPQTIKFVHLNGTLISSLSVAMIEMKIALYPVAPRSPST